MAHSILAPSSAGVWAKPGGCLAFPTVAREFPELEESEDARIGEAAHWLGEQFIHQIVATGAHTPNAYLHTAAPNGVAIDDEMIDGAELYALDVTNVSRTDLHVEHRLECHDVHPECFGTPDCFYYNAQTGDLYIWDFKFGRRYVEEFENWQLIVYFAGVMQLFGFNGVADRHIRVHLRIVQPRAYGAGGPVREWSVTASDLRAQVNIAESNAERALAGDAPATSGMHCRYCPARHSCQAALDAGWNLYEAATSAKPATLTPADMGVHLALIQDAIERLKFLESGYEAQVEALVKRGEIVPNFTTTPKTGRETWTQSAEEVLNLGNLLGVDLHKNGVCTPKQAKSRGLNPDLVDGCTTQPQNGVKITRTNEQKLRKLFS